MNRQRGYTLIELIVVVAVVAILIGLLLPAIQKVRSAAAKLSCANNVKQIGLGLHSYHDAYEAFPPGLSRKPFGEQQPYLTWRARLLPFIEQAALWDQTLAAYAAISNPFFDPRHTAREKVVGAYTCPADDRVRQRWEIPLSNGTAVRTALSSYLGVSGTDSHRADGMLYLNSRVRLTDVTDGSSQTLLIGERPPSRDLLYGWWYAAAGQGENGSVDSHMGVNELNRRGPRYHGCGRGPYSYKPVDPRDDCSAFQFWSPHPGGASFGYADGSVHFLRYEAARVLRAMATRSGGEAVDWVE